MNAVATSTTRVVVWDRVVRFCHWGLALAIGINYFLLSDGETIHRYIGYFALSLVLVRTVWGFVGTPHARFRDFCPTPSRLRQYLQNLRAGKPHPLNGHNLLGALMIFALWTNVALLGLTGWMQGLDAFWGTDQVHDIHELLGNVLLGLIGIHVCAALVMGRIERVRLIRAMVTGVKQRF